MANNNVQEQLRQMQDPVAYRADYNPAEGTGVKLQNADMNINQYGDDSSAVNYNDPTKWGGANQKYTGETTGNTFVAYNPNLTTDQLDPNYKYGQEAQIANSQQANYIAQRNDNIASALYNAGTTSMEDVENFLNTQQGFFNSNENERRNTIQSIYKRLGDLQKQQEKPEETPKKDIRPEMEQLLAQEQNKLYGKVTADTGEPMQGIDTLSDGYAINQQMIQSRINKVQALQNMNPVDIANIVASGTTPYGETAMRDWKKVDPDGYAQFEKALKGTYDQSKVDSITHGAATDETKSFTESVTKNIENDVKNFEKNNTGVDSKEGASSILNIKLESDEAAQTAKQEMLNVQKDIAEIQAQIEDLPRLARESFKGDVPDYLVQAFISNNQQRLQRELNKLESRYNAAAEIYKTEVAEKQREAEYELKKAELDRARTNDAFDRNYKNQKLKLDSIQVVDGVTYMLDPNTGTMVEVDDVTAINAYNTKVAQQSAWGQTLVGVRTGWECEGYTDKQAQATAGVTMVGADGRASTTRKEKVQYATGGGFIGYYDENGNPVWDINGEIHYGDADVYDMIPQVGDIAVGVGGPYDTTWGHTMYIDKVWTDANGKVTFHYTATNKSSKEGEYTVGYEGTKTLDQFLSNGGVGFWNPYKQAQYNGRSQNTTSQYSPMQPIIDAHMKKASQGMLSNLGTFQEIYTNLYNADKDGQLSAMLQQGAIGTFLNNVALQWAQSQGGDGGQISDDNSVTKFFRLTAAEAIAEAENYVAQNGGFKDDPEAQKAYAGFLTMMRAVEIKLRDESGAAINQSERATNFLQYLPKAGDSAYIKSTKLKNMEQYIRRLGTDAGITSSEYIPLNLGGQRDYD